MLNHVELLGRLAQEPEIRYTQRGTAVASFDLAVQIPSKEKDTPPDYIPVVCWANLADFCGRWLAKGRQVVIEGRISTRKWESDDGKKHKVVEVTANHIYFADSNSGNTGSGNGNAQVAESPVDDFAALPDDMDLPFV